MRPLLLLLLSLTSALAAAAPDPTPYPFTPSPKGLQVQMVDDLLELGVHHAGINLTLNGLLSPAKEAKPGQPTASADGFTFVINEAYAKSLDRQIKPLSDKGVVVTAILITYRSPNERIRTLTVHPQADATKGTTMAANTVTPEGRACYKALTDFIARRWCSSDTSHGRLWGWVISNEVNSHHEWHQMGPVTAEQVAEWGGAELVIPAFAAVLGSAVEPATTVLLTSSDSITAVHWTAAGEPAGVVKRTIDAEATDEDRARTKSELVASFGGSRHVIEPTAASVPDPAGTDGAVTFRAGELVSKLSATAAAAAAPDLPR